MYDRAADARQMGLAPLDYRNSDGLLGINEGLRGEVERLRLELAQATRPKFTVRQEVRGER